MACPGSALESLDSHLYVPCVDSQTSVAFSKIAAARIQIIIFGHYSKVRVVLEMNSKKQSLRLSSFFRTMVQFNGNFTAAGAFYRHSFHNQFYLHSLIMSPEISELLHVG